MKKRMLLTAAVVLMSICANAQMFGLQDEQQLLMQQNQQMMQMQQLGNQSAMESNGMFAPAVLGSMNQDLFITDPAYDPIMDMDHGGESDLPGNVAPVGSGAALLVAMGAAYAAMRRRKED